LALALLPLLGACSLVPRSGGYFEDDGPDAPIADAASLPDAVPRAEARSRYGNNPYTVNGKTYSPLAEAKDYRERGIASWYGKKFHGRRTSSGETYDMHAMTAAHKTLPLPSYVRIRNLHNGRSVIVRVNDRGPFLHNRLIDLSYAAAAKLGIVGTGTGVVEVETVGPDDTPATVAAAPPAALPEERPVAPAPPRKPAFAVIPTAAAAENRTEALAPRLFLQVGAFNQWDNAIHLRNRLERAGFRPIAVQSVLLENRNRVYRVRIGPLASVEEGDRLAQQLLQHDVPDALIVVE
jgi:rare lipoprotein A